MEAGISIARGVGGSVGAGLAGVRGEEPGYVFGLFEGDLAGHDAEEEVGEGLGVLIGEDLEREGPEGLGCEG
jgi:hypothetical protein